VTVERCPKCKSVVWVGLHHGCLVEALHPVLSVEPRTTKATERPSVAFFPPVPHPNAWKDAE
jgi:hypothetical protein